MELPVINDLTTTPSLIPYRKGDVWGYADYAGNIVIKPQYREARFFCGELACVTLIDLEKESLFNYNAGNFQIINKKGEIIVEVAQTSIYTITDTTALIINENPFIIDNHKNKYDLSEFNDIIYEGPFGTGKKNGACYLLDSKGSVIKQMNCDSMVEQGVFNNEHQMIIKPLGLGPFKNGLAHMENANDYQYMDRSGNIYTCLNPTIDRLASSWHICPDPFKNNVAVLEQNGKSGVIDNMGNVIIPFGKYYSIDAFSDGMSMVRTSADNDEIIFINTKGQELKPKSNFMFYEVFSGGFARIYFLKGKFNDGFINKSGKSFMLKKTYDQIGLFSDGLCMVKSVEGRFGFIDTTGKETIPANLEYEEVDQFSNGLCRVKSNGLYGFIDRTGKEVIPCTIPEAMPFENGISQLNLKPCDYCNIYLLNKAGETLPYYFQTNDEWINGFHVIHDNTTNLIGVIDETNRIVVEPQYSRINIYPFGIAELIISYEEFYSKSYINLKTGTKYFSE